MHRETLYENTRYYLDAFTDNYSPGNPAAVCVLPEALPRTPCAYCPRKQPAHHRLFNSRRRKLQHRWITPEFERNYATRHIAAGY